MLLDKFFQLFILRRERKEAMRVRIPSLLIYSLLCTIIASVKDLSSSNYYSGSLEMLRAHKKTFLINTLLMQCGVNIPFSRTTHVPQLTSSRDHFTLHRAFLSLFFSLLSGSVECSSSSSSLLKTTHRADMKREEKRDRFEPKHSQTQTL